jgi:L-iditol 2-dehydrogenase
MGTI